jgi:cardiolipin synthase A/B
MECEGGELEIVARGRRGMKHWLSGHRLLCAAMALVFHSATFSAAPVNSGNSSQPSASTPAALAQKTSVVGASGPLPQTARENVVTRTLQQGSQALVQAHLAAIAEQPIDATLYAENSVRLLIDGPSTFEAMFNAISNAKRSIVLESYIIEDAAISRKLAALLTAKRAAGLEVAVIYDAVGSFGTDQNFFDSLTAAKVMVCAFNPVNPLKRLGTWGVSHRDHRKILVVDQVIGFTGGINVSDNYSSGSMSRKRSPEASTENEKGWRDTQIEIHGPAARALDELVRNTWQQQECRGELQKTGPDKPAKVRAAGTQLISIVPASPKDEVSRIYTLLLTSIQAAQRSVYLTMAYFSPGEEMIDALCLASERGVEVKLILPSKSDFSPVWHAGRSYYTRLLEAGIEIHELQDTVLHAKTAVIDGVVSTVGSSNLDWRSFSGNNEVNAFVIGDDFGGTMTSMFTKDLAASEEIKLREWAERPLLQRTKEMLARLFERLL